MIDERVVLPLISLSAVVVVPERVMHFDISKKETVLAVDQAMNADKRIFLVAQKQMVTDEPTQEELYQYGCVVEVKQVMKLPKDVLRILVIGKSRGKLIELISTNKTLSGLIEVKEDDEVIPLEQGEMSDEDFELEITLQMIDEKAKVQVLKEKFTEYANVVKFIKKETLRQIQEIDDLRRLMKIVLAHCNFNYKDVQEIIEIDLLDTRYDLLLNKIVVEIKIQELKEDIKEQVKGNLEKSQKDFYLREQMKVIRSELGEDTVESDADAFIKACNELNASQEVKDQINKEIKRFKNLHSSSAEHGVVRTYIETMLEMPWENCSEDSYDLKVAKNILEEEHYGLEDVKERVLEFMAVRKLKKKGGSPILCLVGPPGTGKTSIVKSLAESMNKSYVRISLGGIHDEAEIRGHRRTYIGSMPGRIANGLKQAGTRNPLILLDEIDKVSKDYKGDAYSALLEVLDSEQNMNFRDHYLEVPVDLSEVSFVATANSLQSIPRPLLDRMEIIEVHSYTENEKLHIAEKHLLPKQLEQHGLSEKELTISKAALGKIISGYTKEAGVRQLERKIGAVCRKVAKEFVEEKKKVRLTETNLEKYLGQKKFRHEIMNIAPEVGVVCGLAWTNVGGTILKIEVLSMPGKGSVTLTGQLGNVMKESATAAISYIRTIAAEYEIPSNYFLKHDLHIHIPEGAVPKDGPSAGITMATAILSSVTEQQVRADVAMTGEVTLRGKVLPIGGLKEKILAAKNAGIQTVIIPSQNQKDIKELSTEITKGLEIIPVEHMTEVCKIAFVK